MRPKNLGFEDCDIIPYCRITEPNTQTHECDSQNYNRDPKKASKLPIPRDLNIDERVVNTHSSNKTEHDPEKEINQKPKKCKDFKSSSETKFTNKRSNRHSSLSQKCSSENVSIRDSSQDSYNSDSSENECKEKHPHDNRDKNSTNSTSSAVSLTPKHKKCRKRLYKKKSKICLKNNIEILESTCKIPLTKKHKPVNSGKINSNDSGEKVKVKCSRNNLSDCSDSCASICPHSKSTKTCNPSNFCSNCQKFYESILTSINSHSVEEKSCKNCIKNKQLFEDNKKKISHDTEDDQLSQFEVEERKISYEELLEGKSNTKCPTTEKTCDNFGAKLSSQISEKINESFCNDSSENKNLEKDLLEENFSQSKSCSDYASKEQDSRKGLSEEQSRKPVAKKKCDCKDRKYCKIDPDNEDYKEKVGDIYSSNKSNICAITSEPILNCPTSKQYFEDFCKENEKLKQLEKTRKCAENKKNKLESMLNPSNTNKNIITREETSEKQLSESLKKKKCACRKTNDNKDLQTLSKVASNKQIEKKKCCCKNENKNDQEKKYYDIDLCGKKTYIECPRKKQSFEDFCKEKQKLSEPTDNICSNIRKRQKQCGKQAQDVENKQSFQTKNMTYKLESNLSLSNRAKSTTVLPLENQIDLIERFRDFELESDSSSNSIRLSASILLLKMQNPYLREYLGDSETSTNPSLSVSNLSPKSISQVCSQSSLSSETKFSELFKKSFHSDNNNKCMTKRLDKGISKQVSTESFQEKNTFGTKLCGKWSLYQIQIQSESDEELCRQYEEYLRQEEEFRAAEFSTSSDQNMNLSQSDYLFSMNSPNSSSESIKKLPLIIEKEKLPSSIPVTGEGPLKSNQNEIKIWNNCLSMLLGSGNTDNSASKTLTPELFQSTMESESGTKKCFTNPIMLQAISEENKNTAPSASTEYFCRKKDSTCKVTINRLNAIEENDQKLSLNKDESTKERSISLSPKISSLDKESLKAFSDAHDQTMATIKYAMQDLADTIYKNTSEVALSAVTRIQSESAKPIEIIKNYRQSEASQINKLIDDNTENKLKIIMSKISGGDESEPPLHEKMYIKANEAIKSTMLYVGDSALGKITLPNFNDESSAYDVPESNLEKKCSKMQDIAHVVSSNLFSDMFATMKAKFWTMFTNTDKREENVSFKASETSVCSNLNESETESEEDITNNLTE
ncbi:unnamed protein product [Arctia plantaginis]|uniref:Uncharacterized protein n=1 Tax=Arctia plantaginis TaxID=874455 RepID=A0A8S1A398_ARCPL|nr:unnamed protein product [Arctia plantaginis]